MFVGQIEGRGGGQGEGGEDGGWWEGNPVQRETSSRAIKEGALGKIGCHSSRRRKGRRGRRVAEGAENWSNSDRLKPSFLPIVYKYQ